MINLTDVMKIWEEIHILNLGELGFCDLEKAVDKICGVKNNVCCSPPRKNIPMEDAPRLIDKSFGDFVDEFLRCAEVIYKTLEAEDHKSQYCLIGNTISVAIRRLPYLEGTGKKGGTCEHTKTNGQDETVGLTQEDQSEGKSAEECSCETQTETEGENCKAVEEEELECLVCRSLIRIPLEINDYDMVECYSCSEPFEYVSGELIKMED